MSGVVHISEAANLGLHAMIFLASDEEKRFSVGEVAQALSISENHLSKVMQRLAKAGLVESTRGPRGGFFLSRNAKETSLLEIFEAIEGPVHPPTCLLGKPRCKGECILGDFVSRTHLEFTKHLGQTRLLDVAHALR